MIGGAVLFGRDDSIPYPPRTRNRARVTRANVETPLWVVVPSQRASSGTSVASQVRTGFCLHFQCSEVRQKPGSLLGAFLYGATGKKLRAPVVLLFGQVHHAIPVSPNVRQLTSAFCVCKLVFGAWRLCPEAASVQSGVRLGSFLRVDNAYL
ncbi:hypothetical protein BJX66DRAFT_66351 [Aspergillus keveii]|uniref:Uncharacterized protein n=1 Tax=Aspergillus keveii TaxID=714993 RepID=A0ABR4FPN0_9EURO